MKKLNSMTTKLYVRAKCAWRCFLYDEQGDTNFISILIILAIVIILAGLFLTIGDDVMKKVADKVNDFFSDLNDTTAPSINPS